MGEKFLEIKKINFLSTKNLKFKFLIIEFLDFLKGEIVYNILIFKILYYFF